MRARRGFTLIELLITAVVMAILGTILARMLVQDSRFVGRVESMMNARQVARAAMNVMSTELRMVSGGGVIAATPTSLTFLSPVGWGMACQRNGGNIIASLIPTDSLTFANAYPQGAAWQDSTGAWDHHFGVITVLGGPRAECTADSIRMIPGGQYIQFAPAPGLGANEIPSGSILYVYEFLEFEFKASASLPGRKALWRLNEFLSFDEELLAPFDSSSHFEFITEPNGAPQTAVPAPLSRILGVEIIIRGESELTPRGATKPEMFELRTRVTFLNR